MMIEEKVQNSSKRKLNNLINKVKDTFMRWWNKLKRI